MRISRFVSDILYENNIKRFFFVYKNGSFVASHNCLNEIRDEICSLRDFKNHEAIFGAIGKRSGLLLTASLHKTKRGQGAGGVRFWEYDNIMSMFTDGLRLSLGMGRKNALSGIWYGGGKGVIGKESTVFSPLHIRRRDIFKDYGDFISSINGCYVTAEDAGVITEDMKDLFSRTRHTTCIPTHLGGSGNPSINTGKGIVCAAESAFGFFGDTLKDKTVCIQGMGNVSRSAVESLVNHEVKRIIGFDINPNALAYYQSLNLKQLELHLLDGNKENSNTTLSTECDLLMPNGLGGTINKDTIPLIKAPIVCGAANNQLLNDDGSDDKLLLENNITYIPDFLANRMGIVTCCDEAFGYVRSSNNLDPMIQRHFQSDWQHSIPAVVRQVLSKSKKDKIGTAAIANELADKKSDEYHPIFPHRSYDIILSLTENNWINSETIDEY